MFERILVGFDGRAQSQDALATATELALRFESSLTIVTVSPGTGGPVDPEFARLLPVGEHERPLGTLLDEARARALERGVRGVEVVFLRGEAAPSIVRYLAKSPHDLLVVGTRGLSRAHRLLLGSVSASLVNAVPCPILVVRPPRRRP